MENFEELKNQVRDLISKNKTKKALEILAKESLSAIDKKLILLNGRYKKIEDDMTFGIIDDDEVRQEINKINLALLDLSDEIGEVQKEEEAGVAKSISTTSSGTSQSSAASKSKNLWKILIPVLLGVIVIVVLITQPWASDGGGVKDITDAPGTSVDPVTTTAVGVTSINPNSYYKLATAFTGDQKLLDVELDGNLNYPVLSSSSSRLWRFTPESDGYYRITAEGFPGLSMDIVNDDYDDTPVLFPSENTTGQFWGVVYEGDGYFRITNYWDATAGKSLDVINEGDRSELTLAETRQATGQSWKLIER